MATDRDTRDTNESEPRERTLPETGELAAYTKEHGPRSGKSSRATLLVVGDDIFASHNLGDQKVVDIGRGTASAVRVDHDSVSRTHARLTLDPLTIEDLESSNGTRVNGSKIAPGERVPVEFDSPIILGNITLILQRRARSLRSRRIRSHDYFEGRLEDECARAERYGAAFVVAHVVVESKGPGQSADPCFIATLRDVDVVGLYGPNEYEVILVDTPIENATIVTDRLIDTLKQRGFSAKIGVAGFPADSRSADTLHAEARARARAGDDEDDDGEFEDVIVRDERMRELHRLVQKVASSEITVLLLGETGVGKEVVAEAIHRRSRRAKHEFVKLNCAALTETLFESELFGHERGAFTGANKTKKGLLESAGRGTIFLDEVGELPPQAQVKLLRVLEERKATRVGGLSPKKINARFISATNRDLEAAVARGTFREDLYYRLNGMSITIPPLRERSAEIPYLVDHFVKTACERIDRKPPSISRQALELLETYAWPGNIRELRNIIERAVVLCSGPAIRLADLPAEKMQSTVTMVKQSMPISPLTGPEIAAGAASMQRTRAVDPIELDESPTGRIGPEDSAVTQRAPAIPPVPAGLDLSPEEVEERNRIVIALDECAGNQTRAAAQLGISRRTLINRLDIYRLPRPRKRRRRR